MTQVLSHRETEGCPQHSNPLLIYQWPIHSAPAQLTYLCRFLFFRFLWLPWWLPEEVEEAAFWGFTPWTEPSSSSPSSWLGSFSWLWKSGDVSLSVPLPGSPETGQIQIHLKGSAAGKRTKSFLLFWQGGERKGVEQASKSNPPDAWLQV